MCCPARRSTCRANVAFWNRRIKHSVIRNAEMVIMATTEIMLARATSLISAEKHGSNGRIFQKLR